MLHLVGTAWLITMVVESLDIALLLRALGLMEGIVRGGLIGQNGAAARAHRAERDARRFRFFFGDVVQNISKRNAVG